MSPPSLESLAGRINREHQAALEDATSAVAHARLAGRLLLEARERCERGQWETWLGQNCSEIAERTAQQYMRVARHPEIEAGSISEAVLKLAAPRKPNNPHGHAGPQESDSSQNSPRDATARQPTPQSLPERGPDMPEEGAVPEAHEAEQLEAALKEQDAAVERVLGGAGTEELKRQAAEIAALKSSRDSFMNGKAANERLLAAANRKVDRLKARVKELEAENEALRERLAVVQEQKDAA